MAKMRFYQVGGCVRDRKMGFRPQDIDYVVTGCASVDDLVAAKPFGASFSRIDASFPIAICDRGDEWALARLERKTGEGYHGFEVDFSPEVTIEMDLGRRDLTINSMAIEIFDDMETHIVEIIDPYNGQKDIEDKVLRHATDAFMEDPVRVLRLARFRARMGADWAVAPETAVMIAKMAKAGTLDELTPERIWKELSRALMEPHPRLFFDTLLQCDALHVLFPEVYKLKTALEAIRWHPEGDAYEHTMLVLTQAALFDFPLDVRFATLTHDFGKGLTPRDQLPKHYGHDVKGVKVVTAFADRLTVPVKMKVTAEFACRYHMYCHKLDELKPKTFAKMFTDMGSLNNPRTVEVLHAVGVCDERGRLGAEQNSVDHVDVLTRKFEAFKSVKFNDVFPEGQTNVNKIKDGMLRARIKAVAAS